MVQCNISDSEIREAGKNSTIIENYPTDKYGPSCLLPGFADTGRPLHIQVSRTDSEFIKIITVYAPDPDEWAAGFSKRR